MCVGYTGGTRYRLTLVGGMAWQAIQYVRGVLWGERDLVLH